jgi:hypothetical protein
MYGQLYKIDYETLEECKNASELFYGKNTCSKTFIQIPKPPLPRPKNLLGDKV